jgi:hypothetical protein
MTPIEFINTGIKYGDKVELTLESGKEVTGFFGGFKTFGLVEPELDYIMPVFYAPKKDGTMGKRSAFGPDTCTNIPYSSIKTIKIC